MKVERPRPELPYIRRQTKKGKPDKSGDKAPVVPKTRPPLLP